MHRTLTGYIVGAILPPFFVGLLAFTLILLTARIVRLIELVVSRGVPFLEVTKLFALILPTFLETTLPMAFLLGILFGCGRLSSDLETLAFKACGVSPIGFLLPVGLVALVVSLMTLALSTFVRPAASIAVKKELYTIAKGSAGSLLREKVFNNYFPKVLIYVDEIIPPGNTLQGVLIVDRRDETKENLIIGRVGLLLTGEGTNTISLRLFDGTIHERQTERSGFSQTSFNVYHFRLDLADALSLFDEKKASPSDMSLQQLGATIRLKQSTGVTPTLELMETHQRFAFSFAPLVFGLLGIAIVMAPSRSGASRSRGVASCLFWLLAYYGLLSFGRAIGEREFINPALALWLPNLTVGLVATYLFAKTLRNSPSRIYTNRQQSSPANGKTRLPQGATVK